MTSSSCHFYFHTPSRDQTKLGPVEKYWLQSFIMSVHPFTVLDKFVQFFYTYYLSRLLLLTSTVFDHLTVKDSLH